MQVAKVKIPIRILLPSAIAVSAVIFVVLIATGTQLKDAVTTSGVALAGFSFAATAYAIVETHRWNRYQHTLKMMADWNTQIRVPHLSIIERRFPQCRKLPKEREKRATWRLNESDAMKVANANSTDACSAPSTNMKEITDADVRNSLICVFNYFEGLARAYELSAVEPDTIEESFAPLMIDYWEYFSPFVSEIKNSLEREPWPPLRNVCEEWIDSNIRYGIELRVKERSERRAAKRQPPTGA